MIWQKLVGPERRACVLTVIGILLYNFSARSKTLNAATASGLPDVTADIFDHNTASIIADTDDGKPLMATVNKRLSLRNGKCARTSGRYFIPNLLNS